MLIWKVYNYLIWSFQKKNFKKVISNKSKISQKFKIKKNHKQTPILKNYIESQGKGVLHRQENTKFKRCVKIWSNI